MTVTQLGFSPSSCFSCRKEATLKGIWEVEAEKVRVEMQHSWPPPVFSAVLAEMQGPWAQWGGVREVGGSHHGCGITKQPKVGSDGKESTCNAGDLGSIPGLGRSPGGGHGNPL